VSARPDLLGLLPFADVADTDPDALPFGEEEPSFRACSECGHLHWNPYVGRYEECPLAGDGCECPYAEGEDR
jgi:hypothetical protein